MMHHHTAKSAGVPPVIHVVNLAALLLLGVILLFAAAVRWRDLGLLVLIGVLMAGYWRWRTHPNVAAGALGLSMAVLSWMLLCENIVRIDNLFGSQLTRRLTLGMRLQAYVDAHLTGPGRKEYFQPCCSDPMAWHYIPGSTYRETYDCETCNAPYAVVADETGNLNRPQELWASRTQIDLFVAGDSVLQGLGVPSVVEVLRDQLPVTLWNLSIAGYGPRQKVSALLTYALPKHPRWLVVEFYARNDITDAIVTDVCEDTEDFRCRYSIPDYTYRLAHHPIYGPLVKVSADFFTTLEYYAAQNFTLATTRYILSTLKTQLKRALMDGTPPAGAPQERPQARDHREPVFIASAEQASIQRKKLFEWVTVGLPLLQRQYDRLAAGVAALDHPPTVILLYNPTPYELYRDLLTERRPDYEKVAQLQLGAHRAFAQHYGWVLLDLTEPLREMLKANNAWLYGRYDPSHWSPEGTALVAPVLRNELLKVIGKGDAFLSTR
jgi:hypothetical protein